MRFSRKKYTSELPLPATDKWPEGVWDIEAFRHGSMSLILFAPEGKDYQTSHNQDELYIILTGSGTLNIEGVPIEFQSGDALFVAAGKHHRFTQFEKGTEMWAVFYGPPGGEPNA
jgi:mannose-6-phosphate isomerase-like protein (cupin superfamily)